MCFALLHLQVNIDGHALPVKKLNGTEPVETLNFSSKELGPASAMVIASLISANGSLTSLSLGDNNLGDEGVEALSIGLKNSKSLTTLDLSNGDYWSTKFGPKGATALASLRLSPARPR